MSATPMKSIAPNGRIAQMRQRLIDAARAEFGENGIECATTRRIAERAGCNEVTLFRHFESKQKLLGIVVRETSEEFREFCEAPSEMTGDLRKDLHRFARVCNESLERCEGMARALIGEGMRQPTLTKELINDALDPFHQSIARYLRAGIRDGRVRSDLKVGSFAQLFTTTLMGGMLRRTSDLSKLKAESCLRETLDLLARSIEVH